MTTDQINRIIEARRHFEDGKKAILDLLADMDSTCTSDELAELLAVFSWAQNAIDILNKIQPSLAASPA